MMERCNYFYQKNMSIIKLDKLNKEQYEIKKMIQKEKKNINFYIFSNTFLLSRFQICLSNSK